MDEKPNVLLILTDQQRFDTIRSAGYSHMKTPHLDRLASEGCLYTHAYSTNPVCVPARHDLITGLPGRAHGYFANAKKPIKDYSLPTLARIFAENGYRTAAIGKMHYTPTRMHHGFGEMRLMEEIPVNRQDDQYAAYLEEQGLGHLQNIHGVRPHVYHIPQQAQMNVEHHGTTWVARETVQWLRTNKNAPFCIVSSFIHPHPPWDLPPQFQGLYKDQPLPEPIVRSRSFPRSAEPSDWCGDHDSPLAKRKVREAYYSSITMVDHYIGTILDELEQSGQLDRTLIIFTSDHGEMLQDKGYYSKSLPYEGSARIPFIVRYPKRFKPGTKNEQFVDLFDILPTCLDICGLTYNHDKYVLPGGSLCHNTRDRTFQISSFGTGRSRWIMVRNEQFKYIYYYLQGTEELYDLKADAGEIVNLLAVRNAGLDASVIQHYAKLRQQALEFEQKWGPEEMLADGDFIRIAGDFDHPNGTGKFPLWSNHQMQKFNSIDGKVRAEQFLQEIRHAISRLEHSGVSLQDVMNDPLWIESFKKSWEAFTGSEDEEAMLATLFKQEP